MERKRKMLIIAGIIIFLIVGIYFLLQSSFLLNKVRGILESQFTNQLGTEVKLGQLSGNLLYGLKIEDVKIADKDEPEKTIISTEKLLIDYKVFKLLLRTFAVKKLILQRPIIHAVVDEQGEINLSKLIPTEPESADEEPYLIQAQEVKLVDGHIYYEDKLRNIDANISGINLGLSGPLSPWNHKGRLAFQNAVIEINDVKKDIGTFDMNFHFTQEGGQLEQLRLEMEDSWLEVTADANFKSPAWQANINGEINLKDIANLSPPKTGFSTLTQNLEGVVRLNAFASLTNAFGLWSASGELNALSGHLELAAPNILFNNLNWTDVSLDADFTNNSIQTFSLKLNQFSANIADGNVQATAQAQINNEQPSYEAQLSLKSIQVQKLFPSVIAQRYLPLSLLRKPPEDNIPLTGEIQGEIKLSAVGALPNGDGKTKSSVSEANIDWSRLTTEGQFELSNGTFNGIKLLPSSLNYTLQNEQLTANANIDKIQAEVNGQLDLRDKIDLKVNLNSVDLSRLSKFAALDFEMVGMGTLKAKIDGNLTKPKMSADLIVQDIAMNGTRLGDVTGQFLYADGQVQIDELRLLNADTQCVVGGKLMLSNVQTVDLNVALNPLQISEYAPLIIGEEAKPDGKTKSSVSEANAKAKPCVNEVNRTTFLDLQGRILGEIALHGSVTALDGNGKLVARDMFVSLMDDSGLKKLFSFPIEMTAPLELKKGILQTPELTLRTTGGEFYINGKYNPTGEYQFQMNSEGLNLTNIANIFGIEKLKGDGRLTASGEGTLAKPEAKAHLALKSVQYADVKIGDADYNFHYHNNKIQINAVALADTFKLGGEIGLVHPMPFDFGVQLEQLDFGVLLEPLSSSIYSLAVTDTPGGRMGGETTGVFNISGELANIMTSRGNLQLQSFALHTPHHRFFNSNPIKIAFANQIINVKQFELLQQQNVAPSLRNSEFGIPTQKKENPSIHSALVMKGQIGPEKSDFTAQSDEFDLSILKDIIIGQQAQSYFNATNISGVGKFKLHLTGSYSNPTFAFNWDFPEVSLESYVNAHNGNPEASVNKAKPSTSNLQTTAINIPINSRGRVNYRDKLLIIDQIQLALYSNPLELKGAVPVDLTLFPVKSERSFQFIWQQRFSDSPMEIQIKAPNWDINFIEQFISAVEEIGGYANTHIEVSGTPINPKVSGYIRINDVSLRLPVIEPPLENLSADINVNIDPMNEASVPWLTCTFDSLKWNIGQGRYAVTGDVQYRRATIANPKITSWFDAELLSALKESTTKPEVELTFQGDDMDLSAFVDIHSKFASGGLRSKLASRDYFVNRLSLRTETDAFQSKDGANASQHSSFTKPALERSEGFEDRFNGYASMTAKVKGKGIKPQDYTVRAEIEPLVLAVGDYGLQSDGKIKIEFQHGQFQFDAINLKGQEGKTARRQEGKGAREQIEKPGSARSLAFERSEENRAKPELSLSGSADLDGHFDFKVDMRQFNLKILSPFLQDIPPIDGLVSIQLDANGTTAEPEVYTSFEMENIHVQNINTVLSDINVDNIKGSLTLKDEILALNTTSLRAYNNEITFYGAVPFSTTGVFVSDANRELRAEQIEPNPAPMQLFIKAEQIDLAPFANLSKITEEISGKAHLDIVLNGIPYTSTPSTSNPFGDLVKSYLTGNFTITDGQIKLVNLNAPIESLNLDLSATQVESGAINSEIQLNEFRFQLNGGKYEIASRIKMAGLMPQQYDGTLNIDKFKLDIIDSFLAAGEITSATETEKQVSGYLSLNAETKLNLDNLLDIVLGDKEKGDISPELKPEQKFWQFMQAAMGSKVTLPELEIQIAGHSIYNPKPITAFLDKGVLSLPNCVLHYKEKKTNPVFLKAYGRWEFVGQIFDLTRELRPKLGKSSDQLTFEFMGFADIQMIASLTHLSEILSELTASSNVLEEPISGLIEYRVSMRGSASEPQITVSWPVANIGFLGADVELMESEIVFERGKFNIPEIKLVTERTDIENIANINSILVTGQIPFNLSFMPYVLSPSEQELDLTASASIAKLDSLPLLAMQDATIDGNGNIDVKISGAIQQPKFSGSMTLQDVVYQYENVDVNDTNVKLLFDSNSITIKQAQGNFNQGSYQCSPEGKVGLSGYKLTTLEIFGNWRDVEWQQEGIVELICEGSVKLVGSFDKPRLEGNVTVKKGQFEQSWQTIVKNIIGGQPEGREEVILDYPLLKDLELDLHVLIPQEPPNHFWLDTIGTKIQPQVIGRVVGPVNPIHRLVFVGQVDILEGEFSYFNRKFLIQSGKIENSSQYVLDPNYDINAEIATPIMGANIPGAQEPKNVKVTLDMKGSLQSPQAPVFEAEVINPTRGKEYNFDQLEILELLTFGSIIRQQGEAVTFASETATDLIMRQAEIFLGSQITGSQIADTFNLREFQLDISDQDGSLPQFLITTEISPQLAITYMSAHSLSAKPHLFGIEYKLDDNVSIAYTRNEYGKSGVDLKYGIEW